MYLDISATNLAGTGEFFGQGFNCVTDFHMGIMYYIGNEQFSSESSSGNKSDIPGLESRVDNPLEFLNLYNTKNNACLRQNIPAKIVILPKLLHTIKILLFVFIPLS